MDFCIGTGGLKSNYEQEYEKIFFYSIQKNIPIHTSLDYPYIESYFNQAYKENIGKPLVIVKIFINRNPIKKIINIPKQIQKILDKLKIDKVHALQICNNPSYKFYNNKLIDLIFKNLKKKQVVENLYFDTHYDYNENLLNYINNEIYNGYISTYNLFNRGISNELYNKIILNNKNIIAISPVNITKILDNINEIDIKILHSLKKKYDFYDLQCLSLAYLNSIKINRVILGTKKFKRLINQIDFINKNVVLNSESLFKIKKIQKKIEYFNGY